MNKGIETRQILWFFVKFLILAPLCLAAWWAILPGYAWLIGQLSGMALKYLFQEPITAFTVKAAGLMNTETALFYSLGDRVKQFPVGLLVTNIAPFIALILSTTGLKVLRRIRILILGIAILAIVHIGFILFIYHFTARKGATPEIPAAIGEFSITLPFLLWIILAYWSRLTSFFTTQKNKV